MPNNGMDWWTVAGVIIAAVTLFAALRSPAIRQKLGLKITNSKRVEFDATQKTEADVTIKRSEDVRVKIGD